MDMNLLKTSFQPFAEEQAPHESTDLSKDIAIIGIDAKIGEAKNINEFWDMLCQGYDFIRDFPQSRWKDANDLYYLKMGENMADESGQGAYLESVDGFDAEFFHIAGTEADIMDPSQRLFLESAWSAIEDAGYSSEQMNGTNTGVYVGYTNMGEQYSEAVLSTPDNYGIKMSGNISSMIAARVSYCMNLQGPAVNIDTACSSSLTALHTACRQLCLGEIDMALVGSIKIMLVPRQPNKSKMGIESSSQRTKTFDYTADGTGGGEGVITFLLKPFIRAQEDHDHIYAVVKGSSINQDGASVGITAPNAAAQEKVLMEAWNNAKIDAESISYIEAHGTATNLGDPVEIKGIERAFSHYTDKKQFCAVSSVKSNVGHLDCAAGMAGLLKATLMLVNKKMPPIVHFRQPNRKVDFIDSPVYIQDRLSPWNKGDTPRRCGISSFGLSGTNAHVILEEAPAPNAKKSKKQLQILVLSARTKNALENMLASYKDFARYNPECNLDNFCFTANSGRTQFPFRFAALIESLSDLQNLDISHADHDKTFFGSYRLSDHASGEGYLSSQQKSALTKELNEIVKNCGKDNYDLDILKTLSEKFVKGADFNWDSFYDVERYGRISIPTYPFEHKRHWLSFRPEDMQASVKKGSKKKLHPLIDCLLVKDRKIMVYESRMSMDTHWELGEHCINGKSVLPGTAYIEMAYFISRQYFKNNDFEMHDMIYLVPFSCAKGETRLVHIIVNMEEDALNIEVHSMIENMEEENWECNARVKVIRYKRTEKTYCDVKSIIDRCYEVEHKTDKSVTIVNIDGFHWGRNFLHGYANDDEIVVDLKLHESLLEEAEAYNMLPSLLDTAISFGHHFFRSVYIPYCFSQARFYEPLPIQFYSYIKKKEAKKDSDEIAAFDVVICDVDGRVIAEVDNYVIRKIHQPEFFLVTQNLAGNTFFDIKWNEVSPPKKDDKKPLLPKECVVAFFSNEASQISLLEKLKAHYKEQLIAVEVIENGGKASAAYKADYVLEADQVKYDQVISEIKENRIRSVISLAGYSKNVPTEISEVEQGISKKLKTTFFVIKALVANNVKYQIKFYFPTLYGNAVTGEEPMIYPGNHALAGMGLGIRDEYSNILGKNIDCDDETSFEVIINEMESNEKMYAVSYRGNKKYRQQLENLSYQEEVFEHKLPLKDNHVYVIGGGLGGMGLAFTNYLVGQNTQIEIVLLNRSFDEDELLNSPNIKDQRLLRKIEKLQKIKKDGGKVHIVKTDIANYENLKAALASINKEFGPIAGIINAAGVASDGFLIKKEWDKFYDVLKPKIQGTWSLYELTQNEPLDFFVMCSSLASVYGAPGQIDYIAANAYLDSFAFALRKKGTKALTINWSGWSESGMAVDNLIAEDSSFLHFIKDTEGAVMLSYAMKLDIPQVLAGGIKYKEYAAEKKRFEEKVMLPENINEKIELVEQNEQYEINWNNLIVTGKSLEKLTDVEKHVILVWARVLGVTEVDIHDKFFEVGGNSLLASALQKQIDEKYPDILSIMDIFTYASIENISSYIHSNLSGEKELLTIDALVSSNGQEENIDDVVDRFLDGELDMDDIEELL